MVRRTMRGLLAAAFRDNSALQRAVLSGERQWCEGQWGRCSGVFVFYLHTGMSEIHWREEGDPIINRIKYREIILRKRFFPVSFLCVFT